MSQAKLLRVLHAPSIVGGNPYGLSRALQKIGVDSVCLVLRDNYLRYPSDIVLFERDRPKLLQEVRKIAFILSIPFRYDIVHYNFGTTIAEPTFPWVPGDKPVKGLLRRFYSAYGVALQKLELLYLGLYSIPVFVHYQGDDARQGGYTRCHFEYSIAAGAGDEYYNDETDRFKQRAIRRICARCDAVYAVNPDLLHVLPEKAKFVPYSHIDLDDWQPAEPGSKFEGPLRIGHAPTSRAAKGTHYLEAAVEQLRAEGYTFEFVLIEGMSNEEARQRFLEIDLMVDQLVSGWYGGLAVELMAMGKPVVVYIREQDLRFIDSKMAAELPFIQASPDTIVSVLKQVLDGSRDELVEIGRKSRRYVERWHDPVGIAGDILRDYEKALQRRGKLGR